MYTGSVREWSSMMYGSLRPKASELGIWTYPRPTGHTYLSVMLYLWVYVGDTVPVLNSIQLCSVLRVASLELNILSFRYFGFSLNVYVFSGTCLTLAT